MAQTFIPYPIDVVATVAAIRRDWPAVVWLDGDAGGDHSIISAAPREQLISRGGETWVADPLSDRPARALGKGDPLAHLRERLGPVRPGQGPFAGGAIGYFSYELGRRLQGQTVADAGMPEMAVGLYDWALVLDHRRHRAWLAGEPPAALADALTGAAAQSPGPWSTGGHVQCAPGFGDYAEAFHRVMGYLRDGDCYQVNLARRFRGDFEGDPLGLYRDFRTRAGGPFAAYLELPGGPILSGSPERFLRLRDGCVETCPIKGTRPRQADPAADARARESLLSSAKDRAENVMIVDLLRNDIGRCCATGTVTVPRLCALESFATVHHMVSVVTGRLDPRFHATDLLRDCLPGGSITGAPKYRAMEIIDELEDGPRGVYCGAIGYIGYDGAMDSNIAIRTMTARDGQLDYHAGGGLVMDSACREEYDETSAKAEAFCGVVEQGGQTHVAEQQFPFDADMMQSFDR